jgi:ATP-binding cassette, subfamily B, bacterial
MKKRKGISSYKKVYKLLLSTYGKDWYVRVSFILAFISRLAKFIALPVAASQVIASLAVQDFDRARTYVLVFVSFSALIGILAPTIKYISLKGENNIYAKMMKKYVDALLHKDVRYFNDNMSGQLTAATRHYSDNTVQFVRKFRDGYLGSFFAMTLPVIVIFVMDVYLGLITLIISVTQIVFLFWASNRIRPYRTKSREIYKALSGYISDVVTNIVAVKSVAQEEVMSKKIGKQMFIESELFMDRYRVQALLRAYREVITVIFFLALFWLTVERMSVGELDVAGAVLVVTYSFTIMSAIYDLSNHIDEHDDLIDKILPAFELVEGANSVLDPKKPRRFGKVRGALEFKNVQFSYSEGAAQAEVFKNLNLQVPAGQKLGVVGLSGAGKSTLVKLLLRFEEIQGGEITIDGIPIDSVRQAELRKSLAYVPQEPLLFHSTIEQNIRLAKQDATIKEVKRAAESAHATNFINTLPNKLDSVVGERGVKLSGGQKQRIAIARAVLQDAPIMLLDEATSALDSESEQIIKDSFAKILKGKTAIVIAHRLSTLSDMDRIVLLHDGEIIEDGTHRSLLQKKGVYAKLWNRQLTHPEDLELNDSKLSKLTK